MGLDKEMYNGDKEDGMRHIPQSLSSQSQEACSEQKFPKKVHSNVKD